MSDAITEYRSSTEYTNAVSSENYFKGKNETIRKFQKLLYTISGQAVPDNFSANHKCASGFLKLFVVQEVSFEVGNGVFFGKKETKEKLGKSIDSKFYKATKEAIIQGASYGFLNVDHLDFFNRKDFFMLKDETDGSFRAGIHFWRLADDKPLRVILFEEDGYTEFIESDRMSDQKFEIVTDKRDYKTRVRKSILGIRTENAGNYNGRLPIIPLWGNLDHDAALCGLQEQIDCYDLIKSGFANDLDEASMFYWTFKNAGGMQDIDLAKFVNKIKTLKAANIPGGDETSAEAHTLDVPYESRQVYLDMLKKDLYAFSMSLDPTQISAGNVTATQIKAAYEPLNEKADELEMCLCEFFDGILDLLGIDDHAYFKRSMISNEAEFTNMVLSVAEYLDDQTVLELVPFISEDKVQEILKRKDAEDSSRFQNIGGGDDE